MTDEIIKTFIYYSIKNNNIQDHDLITNLYPIFKQKKGLSEIVLEIVTEQLTDENKNNIIHFILLMIKKHIDHDFINNQKIIQLFGDKLDHLKKPDKKSWLDLLNLKYISNKYTSFFDIKDIDFCHTITINFLILYGETNHHELLYECFMKTKIRNYIKILQHVILILIP